MRFKYEELFQMGKDTTNYHLLTKEFVSTEMFNGKEILKVEQGERRFPLCGSLKTEY